MGHNPFALLSKLTIQAAAALALSFLLFGLAPAAEIGATIQDVSGIRIPNFDPDTGKRIWLVTAEKAKADDNQNLMVEKPKVILYGKDYNINVSSKNGVVNRDGENFKSLILSGDVVVDMGDPQKTIVTTEKLEWMATDRLLQTDSVINVKRTDLAITGNGFEMMPEEKGKAFRFIQLKRDVRAEISPKAAESGVFAGIVGKKAGDAGQENTEPMFITSEGPMTLNSETNALTFTENVKVKRGDFNIRSDSLQLFFDAESHRIKQIKGTGGVQASNAENGVSGDELSWDAATGLIEIVGKPAKTFRGPSTVTAPIIWFSEKDNKALWTGRVHIFSPRGDDSLFHFGGTRE